MKCFHFSRWRMGDTNHFGAWLQIFGYGIAVSTMRPVFSERMGLSDYWKIGRFKFTLISKGPR